MPAGAGGGKSPKRLGGAEKKVQCKAASRGMVGAEVRTRLWVAAWGWGVRVGPAHQPPGHPAQVLDEDQPQHDWHGPQFADRERRLRLVRPDEEGDVVLVEGAVGVRDQFQGEAVDAGPAAERAAGELRQVVVVAAGQVGADL